MTSTIALIERDIWEVSNQLGGWVGPTTEDRLAKFLIREADEAAKLAYEIVRLRTDLSEAEECAELAAFQRDEAMKALQAVTGTASYQTQFKNYAVSEEAIKMVDAVLSGGKK